MSIKLAPQQNEVKFDLFLVYTPQRITLYDKNLKEVKNVKPRGKKLGGVQDALMKFFISVAKETCDMEVAGDLLEVIWRCISDRVVEGYYGQLNFSYRWASQLVFFEKIKKI